MSTEPIVVEKVVGAPVERVWRAISDGAEMPKWFFEQIEAFKPELGFETTFTVHNAGKDYPHRWRVTEVVPQRKLAYDWHHPGFPGAAVVTWAIAPAAEGTNVRVTHAGIETFPQDDPAFTRESGIRGWEHFLDRLKAFVEA